VGVGVGVSVVDGAAAAEIYTLSLDVGVPISGAGVSVGVGVDADGAFAATTLNALPGACIMYRIVATNEGVSQVTSVLINDTTPSFTTLYDKLVGGVVLTATTPAVTGSGTNNTVTTKPADGAAGALIADVGALNGGQSGTFTFSVRIDN
ncbi:MAG: hypothetical protein KDI39_04735, partial [Pseudomonadales bacterium]|nr:hypothetical protein [Pseudomonadales bacterium]